MSKPKDDANCVRIPEDGVPEDRWLVLGVEAVIELRNRITKLERENERLRGQVRESNRLLCEWQNHAERMHTILGCFAATDTIEKAAQEQSQELVDRDRQLEAAREAVAANLTDHLEAHGVADCTACAYKRGVRHSLEALAALSEGKGDGE